MARSADAIAAENPTTARAAARTSSADVGADRADAAAALGDDVLDHLRDQAAHQFVRHAASDRGRGTGRAISRRNPPSSGSAVEIVESKQPGAQAVVDVVRVVGDVVGDRARPAPRRRRWLQSARSLRGVVVGDPARHAVLAIAADRRAVGVGQRAVVLDQALQRFPGEVQPVEAGIAPLQWR